MDGNEAEPNIEAHRGIVAGSDLEPDRQPLGAGVGHDRTHDGGADAAAAQLGNDRLIDDVHHVARPVDDDAADRPADVLDDVEARLGKFVAIARGLGMELMPHHLLVDVGREQDLEFGLP